MLQDTFWIAFASNPAKHPHMRFLFFTILNAVSSDVESDVDMSVASMPAPNIVHKCLGEITRKG